MGSSAASVLSGEQRNVRRGTLAARLFASLLFASVGALILTRADSVAAEISQSWVALLVWALAIATIDLLPVDLGRIRLTLDMPILLAVALSFSPGVAALVALLAAFDPRELRGEVSVSHALFNRSQISLSVFLASAVFHSVAGVLDPWPVAFIGTAAALAVDIGVNIGLVAIYVLLKTGLNSKTAARSLVIQQPVQLAAIHLGYGLVALVLARLAQDVGLWSVVVLLVPFIAARQLLVRNQELGQLTVELRTRERMLQGALDRIVDERRDERHRIAGELHDDVLQSLTKMWMIGRLLERDLQTDSANVEDVRELVSLGDLSMASLRQVMTQLRDSPLSKGGLVPTLESLVRDLRLGSGVRINLKASEGINLSADIQVVMYQVAREALINALKHAAASRIEVSLVRENGAAVLETRDDGKGFDQASLDLAEHFGLHLMQERVRRVGGEMHIESVLGEGTKVTARFLG